MSFSIHTSGLGYTTPDPDSRQAIAFYLLVPTESEERPHRYFYIDASGRSALCAVTSTSHPPLYNEYGDKYEIHRFGERIVIRYIPKEEDFNEDTATEFKGLNTNRKVKEASQRVFDYIKKKDKEINLAFSQLKGLRRPDQLDVQTGRVSPFGPGERTWGVLPDGREIAPCRDPYI